MHNLLPAQSTCTAATTTGGSGAGAGMGTAMSAGASAAISPAARFGFHGVPLPRREELEFPTLQLWASPNIPRPVNSTGRHDQHLIDAVSDTDECSILPLAIQFCLSFTSRSTWQYTRAPNSSSCLRYGLPACARHDRFDTLT